MSSHSTMTQRHAETGRKPARPAISRAAAALGCPVGGEHPRWRKTCGLDPRSCRLNFLGVLPGN